MSKIHDATTTCSRESPSTSIGTHTHPCKSNHLYPAHMAKCCFKLTPSAIKDRPAFVGEMVLASVRLGKKPGVIFPERMASLRFYIQQEYLINVRHIENGDSSRISNERILQLLAGKDITECYINRIADKIITKARLIKLAGELNSPFSRVEFALDKYRDDIFLATYSFLLEWKTSKGDDPKIWKELIDALTYVLPRDELSNLFNELETLAASN